ncbi:MAG: GH116 family glycosyl hydrolase, partial [Planctomycetota bacterium]
MVAINERIRHESGIPLGGLGTGSVEVRPDGYFHEWHIFNLGRWAPRQPEGRRSPGPDMAPGALSFYVRTKVEADRPLMRRLGLRMDQHDLYSLAWLKSVEAIDYEGRYPLARLKYVDSSLPVRVSAEMFSPFVPHDSRTSGTPGFYCAFKVRNDSAKPVEVSLLGTLRNPLAWGLAERKLENTITREGEPAILTMRTSAEAECMATMGSMAFSVEGGEPSWIAGEYPQYIRFYHSPGGPYGRSRESALTRFREDGRLASLDASTSPRGLVPGTDEEIDALSADEKARIVAELERHPFAADVLRRVREVDASLLEGEAGLAEFLKDVRRRLVSFGHGEDKRDTWGDGALASSVTLGAREEREIVFTLAWHFPNHMSALGPVLGHMYENWFADAEAVSRFLTSSYESHRARVVAFADTLFDTTLPPEMADAWASQLSTLAKCTWWTRAANFAVWEGLGCCGFHTTDITYQGSFNILALFPDLQKRQMEMGAAHQRDDGRVHHFFTPDLSKVDSGFDRVDMNQQFVLLVCRDWLWTGDRGYLERMWPRIKRAMANTAELDRDGDGLPDHDTRRNTYDVWNFFGTPSYIASLWLGALLAGVRIAEEMGEDVLAAQWRSTLEKGRKAFDAKLWNGEYYSLWVDGDRRDECCMTDQIDGEWFTELIGLGHTLPKERIRAALAAVMKHNFNPEDGLVNATYPPDRRPVIHTFRNMQAMAPWTGILIFYTAKSHLPPAHGVTSWHGGRGTTRADPVVTSTISR